MKKYQIEGTTETRSTERTYTHAVIVPRTDGTIRAIGYCGSQELARKLASSAQAAYLARFYKTTAEIRPVIQIK